MSNKQYRRQIHAMHTVSQLEILDTDTALDGKILQSRSYKDEKIP